jgi:putative endonuclease
VSLLERREAYDRGREAESLVARDLEAHGWTVLARNWRAGRGELDLVVVRDGVLRVVEVKARPEGEDLGALDAVGWDKQRRLREAAEAWLEQHGPPEREIAFLLAVVTFTAGTWSIEYWDDPF